MNKENQKPIWIIENIAKEPSCQELARAVKENNLDLLELNIFQNE